MNDIAERRMFAKTIIDSDAFLELPLSTQSLYFHLAMRADDDGFINNPRRIQRMIGCADDELKLLIAKKFLIVFESGVVVIKHWKIHNYIQKDRYKETVYKDEKELLTIKNNGSYKLTDTECIQNGYSLETQVRLGKDRLELGKDIIEVEQVDATPPKKRFIKPTKEDIEQYCIENNYNIDAEKFIDHYESNGWIVGKTKMKDWKATVRNWNKREKEFKNTAKIVQNSPTSKPNKFHNFEQQYTKMSNEELENIAQNSTNKTLNRWDKNREVN